MYVITSTYKGIHLGIKSKFPCIKPGLILSSIYRKENKIQNMNPNIHQGTVKYIKHTFVVTHRLEQWKHRYAVWGLGKAMFLIVSNPTNMVKPGLESFLEQQPKVTSSRVHQRRRKSSPLKHFLFLPSETAVALPLEVNNNRAQCPHVYTAQETSSEWFQGTNS